MTEVTIEQFGGHADGVGDNADAVNAAVAYMFQNSIRSLRFGEGTYNFTKRPDTFTYGFFLKCAGKQVTFFNRSYSEAYWLNGLFHWKGAQPLGILGGASLQAVAGSTGGAMIAAESTADLIGGWAVFEDLLITAAPGSSFAMPYYLEGAYNPSGFRDIDIRGGLAFSGVNFAMCHNSVFGLSCSQILAGGNVSAIRILNCRYHSYDMANANNIEITNSQQIAITAGAVGNVTIGAGCTGFLLAGEKGTVSNGSPSTFKIL
jgi:hypothetical protein